MAHPRVEQPRFARAEWRPGLAGLSEIDGAVAFLDALTTADLERRPAHDPTANPPVLGSQLQYVTYHYWSHIGEVSAVRQILGHQGLAEYVGDLPPEAEYRREG